MVKPLVADGHGGLVGAPRRRNEKARRAGAADDPDRGTARAAEP
jgi:hypothetical protein